MAIAFFIQANVIGAQAFLIREYKGVRTALFGNLSMAIGFALLLLRDVLPDFLTIIVANTLLTLSPILYYIAVSIGVAFSGYSASMDAILKKADDALYAAKATKDAVVVSK